LPHLSLPPTALHQIISFPCLHHTLYKPLSSSSSNTLFLPPVSRIDISSFRTDLKSSRLITHPPKSLSSLLIAYNTTLSCLLDKHAPVITKLTTRQSPSNPWFTAALRAFRSTVRRAENLWKRTHSAADWSCFKSVRNNYHNLIITAKKHYYSNLVSSSSHNPRRLWHTVNNLLHRKSSSPLPSSTPGVSLADSFASFFTDKISKLRLSLASNPTTTSHI